MLHNFILVSKSNFSVSKLFIFVRIRWVLNLHPTLRQYQIHNVVQVPKANRRTYIFQRRFLVGLYSEPLIIERLIFNCEDLEKN